MEKKSLPNFGQPEDGQPSESPPNANRAKSADGKSQPKSLALKKRAIAPLLISKRYGILHRIAEVRLQQGLSLRAIARRTGLSVRELRVQESPHSNLTLRDLHIWKDALEVPLEHLLIDRDLSVSESIQSRALLIRIMKTVILLRETMVSRRLIIILDVLRQQLVELMPELRHIHGWPSLGTRRGNDEFGKILHEPVVISQLSFLGD
jgi:transcriptional regulator with XRE-family HTH domain